MTCSDVGALPKTVAAFCSKSASGTDVAELLVDSSRSLALNSRLLLRYPVNAPLSLELVSKMVLWQREEKKEACEEKRLRETEEDLAI